MKKSLLTLLIILTLCLAASSAAAENLAAPFPTGSTEAVLVARIAEILGLSYTAGEATSLNSESRAEAANRMLTESQTILCDTQAALMAALQGYTKEDLRTAMVPICRIARCPLYLVMDIGTAGIKGITDSESFLAYIMENEYDDTLLLARHVEADPSDRAATFLADELPLMTDVFWPEEIPDALRNGDAALAVYTEAELNDAAEENLLILFTLGNRFS